MLRPPPRDPLVEPLELRLATAPSSHSAPRLCARGYAAARAGSRTLAERTRETAPTGTQASTINIRFPGQYYDSETGTFENHHRTYDPQLGRYLQSDPIGLTAGPNTYTYVRNNPLTKTDPDGLWETFSEGPGLVRPGVHGGADFRGIGVETNEQVKVIDGRLVIETDVRGKFGGPVGEAVSEIAGASLKGKLGISQNADDGSAQSMFIGIQMSFDIKGPDGQVLKETVNSLDYTWSVAFEFEARNEWEPMVKPNERFCRGRIAVCKKIRGVPKKNIGPSVYFTAGCVGFRDRTPYDPTEPFDPPGFLLTP